MTKKEWSAIAAELGRIREEVRASWPPKEGYMANDPGVADRKLYRGAQLAAIDKVARALCHVIKRGSSRFSGAVFLELARIERE